MSEVEDGDFLVSTARGDESRKAGVAREGGRESRRQRLESDGVGNGDQGTAIEKIRDSAREILTKIPPSAGALDDLWSFDSATMAWTLLSAAANGARPSARYGHGFTSAGGKLYAFGGDSAGAC